MKTEPDASDIPVSPSAPAGDQGAVKRLQEECEHLLRRIQDLESERNRYRAEAMAWARKAFDRMGLDAAALQGHIERGDGVPLKDFLGDLERSAKG